MDITHGITASGQNLTLCSHLDSSANDGNWYTAAASAGVAKRRARARFTGMSCGATARTGTAPAVRRSPQGQIAAVRWAD